MLETKPGMVNIFEHIVQSHWNTSFWVSVLASKPCHVPLNYRYRIKKSDDTRSKYLNGMKLDDIPETLKTLFLNFIIFEMAQSSEYAKCPVILHHSVKRLGLCLNIRDITRGLHPLWEIKAISYQLLGCWLNWLQKLHNHQNHLCLSLLMWVGLKRTLLALHPLLLGY